MATMLPEDAIGVGRTIVVRFNEAIASLLALENDPSRESELGRAIALFHALHTLAHSAAGEALFPGLKEMIERDLALLSALSTPATPEKIRDARLLCEDTASSLLDLIDRQDPSRTITRYHLLNHLIERFSYRRYLEIGCASNECFSMVNAPEKTGVDPVDGGTHRMTSDNFFRENTSTFDIVFIDGLHEYTQVRRDIENSLSRLAPNGTIVLHDCAPAYEVRQIVPPQTGVWSGDVWKAIVDSRMNPVIDTAVGDFDYGCGVIRPRPNTGLLSGFNPHNLQWREICNDKARILRLMEWDSLLAWL